jgi:hypothetical protein
LAREWRLTSGVLWRGVELIGSGGMFFGLPIAGRRRAYAGREVGSGPLCPMAGSSSIRRGGARSAQRDLRTTMATVPARQQMPVRPPPHGGWAGPCRSPAAAEGFVVCLCMEPLQCPFLSPKGVVSPASFLRGLCGAPRVGAPRPCGVGWLGLARCQRLPDYVRGACVHAATLPSWQQIGWPVGRVRP